MMEACRGFFFKILLMQCLVEMLFFTLLEAISLVLHFATV